MISKIESQADVSGLIEVFSEVWGAETLSEFVSSIQHTECLLVKASENEIVGYAFYDRDERGFLEITDIGIREAKRGSGYGKELLEYITKTNRVRLTVRADNPARSVYAKMGFTDISIYQNYYGVGADGIRMEFKEPEVLKVIKSLLGK
jgi:ribosomal protein S18 acetylase RimI-like enzyme